MHFEQGRNYCKAVQYLQQAGKNAVRLSGHEAAIRHLTKALELLSVLPDDRERARQELDLRLTLGPALIAAKGYTVPEVEKTYRRAQDLCQHVGETSQLASVLWALFLFHGVSGQLQAALEITEQYRALAERTQQPALLLETCHMMGVTLFRLGNLSTAHPLLERGAVLYDPRRHHALIFEHGGADHSIQTQLSLLLWHLGFPSRARQFMRDTLTLSHTLSHPFSLAFTLHKAAELHQRCGEVQTVKERAEKAIALSREQGFPSWLAAGTILQGWALTEQGRGKEGILQMRQGLAAWRAMGTEMERSYFLALLAEAYKREGQIEKGLSAVAEALTFVNKTGERWYEAELYRLKGELTLARSRAAIP